MDIMSFLRKSMEKNELEAREYLLQERNKKIQTLSSNSGLPSLFKKKIFQNYDRSINNEAFNQAVDFVKGFPSSSGLLFIGGVGVGKTHLAAAIVNSLNKMLYNTYFGNVVGKILTLKKEDQKNTIKLKLMRH